MKFTDYISSKAISLCGMGIAAICWGMFAHFAGASALLLWVSEAAFVFTVLLRYAAGYALTNAKLKKLQKNKEGLSKKYLLGELLEKPHDAVAREYYEVMKEVSRSAIGETERAAREKEEYFDSVEKWIHEIKTPLTACSLICDNGADEAKLRRELKRADNLTDTVLQYARLRSAEQDTVITKASVANMIAEAVKSQRELLVTAKIGVETSGDFSVYTDAKSFSFIIKQLLVNCAKYCEGCKVRITAQNGIVTVADNGPGIAAHELPRIFNRGFTGSNGRNAGTGMGLYIVSELCKRLDITLKADSEPNKGTTFSFEFNSITARK